MRGVGEVVDDQPRDEPCDVPRHPDVRQVVDDEPREGKYICCGRETGSHDAQRNDQAHT
jgi:hypothetical protein